MTANISRRRLIESSIVGTAALAGATSAFASKPVAKWDETVDIIVVGSGFAGLAAAIEAKNAGANVIVLEKREADDCRRHRDRQAASRQRAA